MPPAKQVLFVSQERLSEEITHSSLQLVETSEQEAIHYLYTRSPSAVLIHVSTREEIESKKKIFEALLPHTQTFVIAVLGESLWHDPKSRLVLYDQGVRMLTQNLVNVSYALDMISSQLGSKGSYKCPSCGLNGLTEAALHRHYTLYHSTEPNITAECPICHKTAKAERGGPDVHIHNHHGPPEEREPPKPAFAAFSWVVVRRPSDGRFLLVNEPAGIAGGRPNYWLPAGRVDAGESFVEAAERECIEEAGLEVEVKGLLKLMWHGCPRALLYAEPTGGGSLKSIPDFESCGACWVNLEELSWLDQGKDYRGLAEPAKYFPKVASGEIIAESLDSSKFEALEAALKLATADPMGRGEAVQRAFDAYR